MYVVSATIGERPRVAILIRRARTCEHARPAEVRAAAQVPDEAEHRAAPMADGDDVEQRVGRDPPAQPGGRGRRGGMFATKTWPYVASLQEASIESAIVGGSKSLTARKPARSAARLSVEFFAVYCVRARRGSRR